jgi:hypothetical protein
MGRGTVRRVTEDDEAGPVAAACSDEVRRVVDDRGEARVVGGLLRVSRGIGEWPARSETAASGAILELHGQLASAGSAVTAGGK